ncbi:carbon storage regulator [bacterium]|nr:MAG: carbon storage regulator [bacterium]
MLILTRKVNEEIKIGPDITIRFLAASEGQVKVGIEAPSYVQILRGEIFEKIVQSTLDASTKSGVKVDGISTLKLNKLD